MKRLIDRFKNKPTIFLILCSLTLICGVPAFIYAIGLSGGASLGAMLPAGAMFIAAIALWIDHGLVNYSQIKLGWVSAIETGILGCLLMFILYMDRSANIYVTNKKQDHLIIIDSPKGLLPAAFKTSWLFSKKYDVHHEQTLYLNQSAFNNFPIQVHSVSGTQSARFGYRPEYKFNWAIYFFGTEGGKGYTDKELDSLISLKMKSR